MWKKPENPTACGGDEWQAGVWGRQPPRAFSLEEAPPPLVPGPKDQGLAAGFFTHSNLCALSFVVAMDSVAAGDRAMNDPSKVFIVDDDDLFRQRTRAWLEGADGIAFVGEAKDGQQAIALIRETRPDVILMDISARPASKLQTVGQICELFPDTKMIVLNEQGQEQLMIEAFRKGALGHLVKGKAQPAEIVEAIRTVSGGKAILSPGVAGRILDKIIQEQQRKAAKQDVS
jgi:DNA-binding NarL/FixJ family response regulator